MIESAFLISVYKNYKLEYFKEAIESIGREDILHYSIIRNPFNHSTIAMRKNFNVAGKEQIVK